jgi:hypothetical protein
VREGMSRGGRTRAPCSLCSMSVSDVPSVTRTGAPSVRQAFC